MLAATRKNAINVNLSLNSNATRFQWIFNRFTAISQTDFICLLSHLPFVSHASATISTSSISTSSIVYQMPCIAKISVLKSILKAIYHLCDPCNAFRVQTKQQHWQYSLQLLFPASVCTTIVSPVVCWSQFQQMVFCHKSTHTKAVMRMDGIAQSMRKIRIALHTHTQTRR